VIPALLAAITGQKERVAWALVALTLALWVFNTGRDVGNLEAQVKYQSQAIEMLSQQVADCG